MHNDSDKPLGCEDLCDEIFPKKFATINKCASGCSREYMICSNNCVYLKLQKCAECGEIIETNLHSVCAWCFDPICALCTEISENAKDYVPLTDGDENLTDGDEIMTEN